MELRDQIWAELNKLTSFKSLSAEDLKYYQKMSDRELIQAYQTFKLSDQDILQSKKEFLTGVEATEEKLRTDFKTESKIVIKSNEKMLQQNDGEEADQLINKL